VASIVLLAAVILAAAVAFDWLIIALLWRLKKGAFEITRDDAETFAVRTDHGHFAISRPRCVLRAGVGGHATEVPLDRVERVDLSHREEPTFWQEWLRGFDLWDVFRRYRDSTQWYEVSILADGRRLPFFVVGQYVPREPLSAWHFELQARVLSRMGLFQDVRERALEVLERLQDALRENGWHGAGIANSSREAPSRPTRG
jgi:hypothetical protein